MKGTRIKVGDLRHRVQVQQQGAGSDANGQAVQTWNVVRETWGKIGTVSSKEIFVVSQFTSELTHVVTIRWTATAISPAMRVAFRNRLFEIQAIENVDERNEWLKLLCVEINGVSS